MTIQLSRYKLEDIDAVRDLFAATWGSSRPRDYDAMMWNDTIVGVSPAIVARDGDRCVGYYAIWPVMLSDGTKTVMAGQAIDSMVHPKYQGRGLLGRMGPECYVLAQSRGIGLLLGAPNKAAIAGNLGKLNWCHVSDVREYVRFLGASRTGWAWKTASIVSQVCLPQSHINMTMECSESSPADLMEFVDLLPKVRGVWTACSDAEWYRYRYRSSAQRSYRWIVLREQGRLAGVAVLGVERRMGKLRKGSIAEILCSPRSNRSDLLSAALTEARAAGLDIVVYKSTSIHFQRELYRNGFLRYRSTPLIARTLNSQCYAANPYRREHWNIDGGVFDTA